MAYSTTQTEACYKIREGESGTVVTRWYRNVERNQDGNPTGKVVFEGLCGEDPAEGYCKLCMYHDTDGSGNLTLEYHCDGEHCDGGECTLQYSMDGQEYHDVTADQPPPESSCYFRCRCNGAG